MTEQCKATKQYLKTLRSVKKEMDRRLVRETKPAFATPEEKQAGLASLYGLIERDVTEEDREKSRRDAAAINAEIKRVESELGAVTK